MPCLLILNGTGQRIKWEQHPSVLFVSAPPMRGESIGILFVVVFLHNTVSIGVQQCT